ncbi:MAG TPA: PQQ-binding-like beta-propeller repeat protein [Polyangia bacterium]
MRCVRSLAASAAVALIAGCTGGEPAPSGSVPSPGPSGFAISGSSSRIARFNDPLAALRAAGRAWLGTPPSRTPPPDAPPPDAPPPDNALDWQFVLTEPINVTPALWVAGATENNATDRMFAYGGYQGTEYLGAADDLYNATPDIAWAETIDSKIDGSAIALTPDGTKVYGVSSKGTVYGFNAADGSRATGFPVSLGHTVSWASPWIDFETQPYALYVADTAGNVTRIDTSTGTKTWSKNVCSKIHSSPIVWSGVVWVGCDDGQLYRLNPATGALYGQKTNLCARSCTGNDAIYSAPFIDSINNWLLVGVNNQVVALDISPSGCTTGTTCTPQFATVGSSAIFYSSPFADVAGGYVYIAFNNRLWRAPYDGTKSNPITAFQQASHALGGVNNEQGYPKSSPMVFNGHVWVGDGAGYVNRFSSSDFSFEAVTPQYGATIDTTPLIDIAGGNIYYGTNGTTTTQHGHVTVSQNSGSWVQLAQNWTYP